MTYFLSEITIILDFPPISIAYYREPTIRTTYQFNHHDSCWHFPPPTTHYHDVIFIISQPCLCKARCRSQQWNIKVMNSSIACSQRRTLCRLLIRGKHAMHSRVYRERRKSEFGTGDRVKDAFLNYKTIGGKHFSIKII